MKLHLSRQTCGKWTCAAGHVEWDDCEWCLGEKSRWSHETPWDSTRIHEILIPWCIKMYQDVPRCTKMLMEVIFENYWTLPVSIFVRMKWTLDSKKSCDVFCHIHELNWTVSLGKLVACFPEFSFPYLMTILTSLLGWFENWATCRSCLFGCCFASLFESMTLQVLYPTTYIIWLS